MTDLAKIVEELSKLTVLEAADLAKMLEEKCLDKPKKFSITKKGYDVKIGCRNSTDFNTYTLNLVIKLTY
jgi:hypothetical protein